MTTAMAPTRVGEPFATTELHPGTLETDLRAGVADYLAGAGAVLAAPTTVPDPLDPAGQQIPLSIHTDGVWLWDSTWVVLVRDHAVAPPADFLTHMAAAGYTPVQLEVAELMAVGVRAGLVAAPE